jgi:hypothetical protein
MEGLSARIEVILEAARFYVESNRTGREDSFGVAESQLVPQIETLVEALKNV